MCGIAGFLSRRFDATHLHSLNTCLEHRGPDAKGTYFNPETAIGLAHRRLSILDLSGAANQPFFSKDGRYVMVYNGEVYNFREVAVRYGMKPVTSSDSEVILEAFAKNGPAMVNDLNGMFAIAIWDMQEQQLFVFRDRIGIKPLYYYHNDHDFAFASELKGLKALPLPRTINNDSVVNFLYLGYIPGTETIYNGFRKLLPGNYMVVKGNALSIHSYWKLEDHITASAITREDDAKKRLAELVRSSVSLSLVSDVPLGIFLSGGVDSSLIASIAQAESSRPVQTYSIGFSESKYNEAVYAEAVARKIGSEHHEFVVKEEDAIEQVENLTGIYDEPYADASAIPTLLLSRLARKHVTVALSGDGGDELFMGYGFYYWARRLDTPLIRTFRKPIGSMLSTFGNNRQKRAGYLFSYPAARRKSHIFSQEQYLFTEEEISHILVNPSPVSLDESIDSHARDLTVTEQQSIFDLKNYLPEELLVKTDRASMRYGLEVRVPLLDHRLIEFALNVSPELKLRGQTGKYLLKEVLYDMLPRELFDRPKWGFAVPLQLWLSGKLAFLLEKYLSRQVVESCGLVKYGPVEKLKKDFLSGRDYLYNRLWALIQLHKWYLEQG